MRIRVLMALLLFVVGTVWIFQGVGTLEGSFMTGQGEWTVIGLVVDMLAVALLLGAYGSRRDADADLD